MINIINNNNNNNIYIIIINEQLKDILLLKINIENLLIKSIIIKIYISKYLKFDYMYDIIDFY